MDVVEGTKDSRRDDAADTIFTGPDGLNLRDRFPITGDFRLINPEDPEVFRLTKGVSFPRLSETVFEPVIRLGIEGETGICVEPEELVRDLCPGDGDRRPL